VSGDHRDRIARDTAIACLTLAVVAAAIWPARWEIAAGVLAGGALVAWSAWAIRGMVNGLLGGARQTPSGVLVKFFTRHAILALAAYGMMARLHLDPVAMLMGVSSLFIAVGVAALRRFQRIG
jgi:hypothetical protein